MGTLIKDTNITNELTLLYNLPQHGITFYTDRKAELFWKKADSNLLPLRQLPWKLQVPFYLKFLHDDRLAERFKDLEILGAIDIYIKSKYFLAEDLGIAR